MSLYEEAVVAYCEGEKFQAAEEVAKVIKNPELNNKLINYIRSKVKGGVVASGDPWKALEVGDYETATDLFRQQGDWTNCLEKAQEKGP